MKALFQNLFSSWSSKDSDAPKAHKGWSLIGFVLVGLLGGLYFFHINAQEEYLTQRNFRILELWNDELTNKIQSFESVFKISSHENPPQLKTNVDKQNNVGVFGPTTKPADGQGLWLNNQSCFKNTSIEKNGKLNPFYLGYRHLCDTGLTNISLSLIPTDRTKPRESLLINAPKNDHDPTFSFNYTKVHSSLTPESLEILAELNLEEFLAKHTNSSAFDDVLIFDSTDKVIYQKSKITFNWNNWGQLWRHTISQSSSSLLNIFNSQTPKDDVSRAQDNAYDSNKKIVNIKPLPASFTISVSDTDYEVFAQASDHLSSNKEFLVVCGIVASDRFRQDMLAVSSTALLLIMVILSVLVLGLPLLRLKMIGPTDPLRLSHTFTLVFSSFLGAGLLTFLFLDFVIYKEAKENINAQIETTADNIRNSMLQELRQILNTLKSYDTSTNLGKQVELLEPVGSSNTVILEEGIKAPCNRGTFKKCYQDYLYAFWTDDRGKLLINWTNSNKQGHAWKGVIDNVDLQKRQYVEQVLHHKNTLWHLDADEQQFQFYLEPITSWTTGMNSVVASITSQNVHGPDIPGVAAIEFRFRSLMKNLVLPPEAGFAIIRNDNYQVLFHSTMTKNLREDFLAETDYDPLLRDLVFARTQGHFDGKYWGEDAHFYVMPISPMPWSIVVYQKREMLRSVNFVILLISGGIFGAYSIIALLGAGFLMGLFRWQKHRKAEWLWPQKEHQERYNGIAVTTALICLIGMMVLGELGNSPGPLLLAGLIFPIFSMSILAAMIYIVIRASEEKPYSNTIDQSSSMKSFSRSYTFMIVSFLVLGAILPAVFIFKAVFFQEMNLVAKHQLMDLYQDSRSRNLHEDAINASDAIYSSTDTKTLDKCSIVDNKKIKVKPSLPYGMYPNAFLATNRCTHSEKSNVEKPPLFDTFYRSVSEPFVPHRKGIQEWGFLTNYYSEKKISEQDSTKKTPAGIHPELPLITQQESTITLDGPLRYRTDRKQQSLSYMRISAELPLEPWILLSSWPTLSPTDIPWWLSVLLLFTGYATILYKIPRFIADEVLFLSYTIPVMGTFLPQLLRNGNSHTPNLIILGYPGQGKTSLFQDTQITQAPNSAYLDLRDTPSTEWEPKINEDRITKHTNVVVLDHFEWGSDEHEMTQSKLDFLEKLLNWKRTRFFHHAGKPYWKISQSSTTVTQQHPRRIHRKEKEVLSFKKLVREIKP